MAADARAPALAKSLACGNTLGEGVLWDEGTGAAIWTDIEERCLHRSLWPFDRVERLAAPERIGSIGLLEQAEGTLMAAFETGFATFHPDTGDVRWLDRPELPPGARFNDGRVDRTGVFWAGTMIEDHALAAGATGALFRLAEGRRATRVLDGIGIPNSLCWSPDGAIMYFADTTRDVIWAFDVADGEPVNRRVFAETSGGAHPDGSTVDADGYLWNAQWGGGQVVRYAPDGQVDLRVEVPAPHVTCVAFGGPELSHLLVTSARADLDADGLAKAPESGALFVFETAFRGIPESRCRLQT